MTNVRALAAAALLGVLLGSSRGAVADVSLDPRIGLALSSATREPGEGRAVQLMPSLGVDLRLGIAGWFVAPTLETSLWTSGFQLFTGAAAGHTFAVGPGRSFELAGELGGHYVHRFLGELSDDVTGDAGAWLPYGGLRLTLATRRSAGRRIGISLLLRHDLASESGVATVTHCEGWLFGTCEQSSHMLDHGGLTAGLFFTVLD